MDIQEPGYTRNISTDDSQGSLDHARDGLSSNQQNVDADMPQPVRTYNHNIL